ncbi:hypothetical protein EOD08_38560, partial [Mesorhizobium sp. M6A.T.Ca.TU.002.02.2.1]
MNRNRLIVHFSSTVYSAFAAFAAGWRVLILAWTAAWAAQDKGRSRKMLDQIKGLHHVTSMARDARQNNEF